MTEFICTDDNHCKNEGVCGRTRDGKCDCKPNYDLKPDCSGKLDNENYLHGHSQQNKTKHNIFILKTEWICTDDISCSNHGTCGATTHGVCDCKGGYGSTANCYGESLHLLND